jgi:polysaccharide biosynthesis protein PslH
VRVLFLTHRLPYAPNRGDRIRAFYLLHAIRRFADVDLVSLVHDDEERSHVGDLQGIVSTVRVVRVGRIGNTVRGILSLPTKRPLTHALLDAPELRSIVDEVCEHHRPDVVFAFCTGIAHVADYDRLRHVPLVLDMVDVDSAKWTALAETASAPRRWIYAREARVLVAFERAIARRAAMTLVTTDTERDTLIAVAGKIPVTVIQNGVDGLALRPPDPPKESATVVFCGVMDYVPNIEAARWLAGDIWPLVRRRRPDARLQLVGSNPTADVANLAAPTAGIEVTGHVADVRPYLWNAALAVAPLLTARGVQNKVLEAVAAGLPAIVTPIVLRGLPSEVWPACVGAADAEAFADAIVMLLNESAAGRRQRADAVDITALSWDRRLDELHAIIASAVTGSQAAPSAHPSMTSTFR